MADQASLLAALAAALKGGHKFGGNTYGGNQFGASAAMVPPPAVHISPQATAPVMPAQSAGAGLGSVLGNLMGKKIGDPNATPPAMQDGGMNAPVPSAPPVQTAQPPMQPPPSIAPGDQPGVVPPPPPQVGANSPSFWERLNMANRAQQVPNYGMAMGQQLQNT